MIPIRLLFSSLNNNIQAERQVEIRSSLRNYMGAPRTTDLEAVDPLAHRYVRVHTASSAFIRLKHSQASKQRILLL